MSRAHAVYPKEAITLREVGLRDGLQMVQQYPGTEAKMAWIAAEAAAGVRHFEIGSFLPARRMPQFSDLRGLIGYCDNTELHSAALVLNERGAQDAVQTPVREIVTVISATEAHSQANMRRSRDAALQLVEQTVQLAQDSVHQPLVQAGISMAFGCSLDGEVAPADVLRLATRAAEAGVDIIGLADTVGFAGPDQVAALTGQVAKEIGDIPINIHLHDTRGLGLANASAALDAGARILDGAMGGLGGCPFAPGATGNVVFEDLVFLAERKGFATGIDLNMFGPVRDLIAKEMPDEPLFGALSRAGPPPKMNWRARA